MNAMWKVHWGATVRRRVLAAAVFAHLVAFAGSAPAQDAVAVKANPLAPFERLVGGQWHLGDSYQEFEWGVGRLSIKATSYFVVDGQPLLVSEGTWYWHPEANVIKGTFTAVEMPASLFEYETRFQADTMLSELTTYDSAGNKKTYVERWKFLDDAHFEWTLFRKTDNELLQEMQGTYVRSD